MKRTLPLLFICAGLVIGCASPRSTVAPAPAPPSALLSQQAVDAVLWQATSAEAHRLYQQCYELARIRLDEALQHRYDLPPCVIVDVDETVLDNSPYEIERIATGTTFTDSTWRAWTAKASARALPGAMEFLTYAASRECEVFYITNRGMSEKEATVRNLKEQGFPFADAGHVLPMEEGSDKTARRVRVGLDYDIKLLIGDQLRDFDEVFRIRMEGFGKPQVDAMRDSLMRQFVIVPNTMYGTWRDVVSGKGTDAEKYAAVQRFFKVNARP